MAISADDAEAQARIAAFLQGLQQLGSTVGKNVRVDYRMAGIEADTLRKYAGELVALAPDVILAQSSPSIAVLLQATRTVPIVFTLIADPVGAGYVDSLAHPGGNATGFSVFEYSIGGKWLELLKEIAPHVTRVAVLRELAVAAGPGSSAPHRPLHRLSAWSCARSIRVMPARWSVPSQRLRGGRTAACL